MKDFTNQVNICICIPSDLVQQKTQLCMVQQNQHFVIRSTHGSILNEWQMLLFCAQAPAHTHKRTRTSW